MLEHPDHCSRGSTLFQFTTRQLRDFIDPNHLLIQIHPPNYSAPRPLPWPKSKSPPFNPDDIFAGQQPLSPPGYHSSAKVLCPALFPRLCQ